MSADNMTHFDKMAALTHQTFNNLISTIPENLAGRKVIAGLVMKQSPEDVGIVISIGTGRVVLCFHSVCLGKGGKGCVLVCCRHRESVVNFSVFLLH